MKRCSTALSRASVSRSRASVSVHVPECLERRLVMAAAFDVTGLTDLRLDAGLFGVDGSGVGVAVLDTGIYGLHPQLRNNVAAYYNAVTTPIPGAIDVTSVQVSADLNGHGSHVAGTVASQNIDVGVAPAARIVAVKVLADPAEAQIGGDPVLRGLQFVQRFADQFNIKVVNMSLGAITPTGGLNINTVPNPDALSRAIDDLEAMGITVVSASGNSYANDPVPGASTPAVFSTISVASTWSTTGVGHDFSGLGGGPTDQYVGFESSALPDRFAASSQRSTLPNQVAAPGVDIFSTWNGAPGIGGAQLFNTISGTSMASPFVSGVVALMQDAAMTFGGRYITNPAQILDILQDTADLVTDSNVADNGRYQIVNGFVVPTPLPLPETGQVFPRVNALNAVRRVRALFLGAPGGDTDSTAANSTTLPALGGGSSIIRRGRIGTDGATVIGPNDVDLFKVTVTTPADVSVVLTPPAGGTLFTPTIRLFDAAGAQITRADGAPGTYPSFRTNPDLPLQPGVYYVGVSSMANVAYNIGTGSGAAGGASEGDYALTIAINNPDRDGVAQGAHSIDLTLPDTLAFASRVASHSPGIIGADAPEPGTTGAPPSVVMAGDVDMYKFVAPDDGTIEARTLSNNLPGGPTVDTYLRLFDSNLVELAFHDDISPPGNLDSLLAHAVQAGQTYYVGVTNFANRTFSPLDPYGRVPNSTPEQEPYSLYLSFSSGDTDGNVIGATAQTIGTPVAAAIGTDAGTVTGANAGSKDVDFVRFAAPAGGLLDLSVAGSAGFESVLALWTYNVEQHTIVKLGEAAGASPRLIRQVAPGQIVYASVTGRGNQDFNWFATASGPGGLTGTYTLNSSLRPMTDLPKLSDGSAQVDTPGSVSAGVPVVGSLGFDGSLVLDADLDVYSFVPAATGRYDIRTDTFSEGSADTVLRLFDGAGNPLALNDNATARTNSSALRVMLAAGQTYYVGVSSGAGGATNYDVRNGAGVTGGSRGGYGLSVTPTAANAPAVTVVDAAPVGESFRGGSAATFTVTLDAPATSAVTVAYVTGDGSAASGADYTASSGSVTFAPGETSKTFTVPVIGDRLGEGDESFGVTVAVLEGGEAVVADESASATIQNQVVQPVGFNSALRATFTDANGSRVVVSLRGPGSGEVLLLGGQSADPAAITLTGTTAASVLTVAGDTSVGDITADGSLRGLVGRTLDLAGNLTVSGSLGQLRLRNVGSGRAISIGPGGATAATLASVTDTSLTSAGAIRSLRVGRWTDSAGAGDVITASSIGSILSPGDFGADVSAGSIGRLTVGGTLSGSDVRTTGRIGAVRLGAASGSRVFAGVRGDVTTLPDGRDDFVEPTAGITRFTVTGRAGSFSNTLVAAPSVGRVLLGAVQTNNGGTPFGVAADALRSLVTPSLRLARLEQPNQSRNDADFNVRIV